MIKKHHALVKQENVKLNIMFVLGGLKLSLIFCLCVLMAFARQDGSCELILNADRYKSECIGGDVIDTAWVKTKPRKKL